MKCKSSVRWYDVTSCGYYKHGETAAPVFGDISSMLAELVHFAKGKKLAQTRLLGSDDTLGTYLAGISSHDGVYVISLWNQVSGDTSNAVKSLPEDALVGQAKAVKTKIAKGNIPGYPTYFVVLPAEGVVGTLKVRDNVPGLDAFKRYANEFLSTSTRQTVTKLAKGEVEILGYRQSKKDEIAKLHPRMVLQVRRDKDRAAYIRENAEKVRKVVRSRTLNVLANPSDFTLWQSFLKAVGMSSKHAGKHEMHVKHQVDVNNDAPAIIALVDEHEHTVVPKDNDFGFVFTGQSEPHWLSNALCNTSFEIDVPAVNGVFLASDLAVKIAAKKAAIIATL
ncbi:hypothetical protein [Stenotrophomonas sp. RG-453]|uniref:hypothetical protein n=1 Tax=Stenotrophomonas sp. RG-453 TaxID=2957502 RepID=UPI0029CAA74C|nr:hypothetical protein [Stenotrophomonas sp. RG-453]MDX5517570.1 hypothetical protein [Stenotrophomonas sp. RG-453]